MKNPKVEFLLLKIYVPILLIVSVSVIIPYLLITSLSPILSYLEIPGVKDNAGLLQLILKSDFLQILTFLIILRFILIRFRKKKSGILFNEGNVYLDIPYIYFFIAKILGYESISLVRIPIALQYKIILKDIFKIIIADKHDKKEESVTAMIQNENRESDEVNLVLSDTYKVEINQLPINKIDLITVCIDSKADIGNRIYNSLFVKEIQSQTHHLANEYKRVNIYSHTNTHHNKEIIESCFKKGGRGEFQAVYVYQYCPKSSKFQEQGIKVK